MYLPPHFEGDRTQAAYLIRQHPFASLIGVDESGLPFIAHLPLHLEIAGEPAFAKQWRGVDDAFARKMLAGIVAFELQVTDLQCKLKINQHRPQAFLAMQAIYENGSDAEQELGRWMNRTGSDSIKTLKG